ncbi:hypothetical protein BaRGS_00028900 [Batillaria attramentaria]|uniref:Uncharacterized protein n=1 Tax=Batillaria attramentaria TaxID=370345 RepID=A0ABD0JYP2_9CAEN
MYLHLTNGNALQEQEQWEWFITTRNSVQSYKETLNTRQTSHKISKRVIATQEVTKDEVVAGRKNIILQSGHELQHATNEREVSLLRSRHSSSLSATASV